MIKLRFTKSFDGFNLREYSDLITHFQIDNKSIEETTTEITIPLNDDHTEEDALYIALKYGGEIVQEEDSSK